MSENFFGITRTPPALVLAAQVAETASSSTSDGAATVVALLEIEGILDQLGIDGDRPPPFSVIPPATLDSVAAGEQGAHLVRDELGEALDALPGDLGHWVESNFNVDVVRISLPDGMSGLCVRSDDRSIAVINQADFVLRRRFTLAHELAHHIFQDGDTLIEETSDDLSFSSSDPVERRANVFAASLLLPAGLATERCSSGVDEARVLDLMFETGMTWTAVVYRLHNLGLIDARDRDWLNQVNASTWAYRQGRYVEWQLVLKSAAMPRPPQRIASRAVTAYERGLIGIGPVAEAMLRDDWEELRQELADQGIRPGPPQVAELVST